MGAEADLTPERWQQVRNVFHSVLELKPDQRPLFLEEACAGDPSLRAEVESLLSSVEQADTVMDNVAPVDLVVESIRKTQDENMTGQRIGAYQILGLLGRGGMADVYLATRADDQYRKRVAIKLVRAGLDNAEMLHRFRNERQTLAALDHPNIVRILDGGSTSAGLPYLVMDYVEGVPIDEYCDSQRLSVSDRLRLFRSVCGAVHYAHQNLIIHRDLKPSNVLVTSDGTPKLLDFGIAKLLNPELSSQTLLMTQTGMRAMTLQYASPEQIRGKPVTTASDIYSLGVVLYELLTGHSPYRLQSKAPLEIERAICDEDPEKLSAIVTRQGQSPADDGGPALTPALVSLTREGRPDKLSRRLAGDLDNIVLMALRREPGRRYTSVEQFSADLQRHLDGLPVTARPATLRYRTSKFVRRNRVAVLAAALIAMILVAGIISTAWEARVARAQKDRAERRFNDVRHLANSFLFEFHDAIQNLSGATPARKLIVLKALEYLDGLAGEASGDASLQTELAEAYLKVGDVQGNPHIGNVGDTPGALKSYGKALVIADRLSRDNPNSFAARYLEARSQKAIGEVLASSGQMSKATETLSRAIDLLARLSANEPKNAKVQIDLADSYNAVGDALGSKSVQNLGDKVGAADNFEKGLAIYQHLAAIDPKNSVILAGLAVSEDKIGEIREANGANADALDWYGKALSIYESLIAEDPTNARRRKDYGAMLDRRAMMRDAMGNKAGALDDANKLLAIEEALSAADSQNMQLRETLWLAYARVGDISEEMGNKNATLLNYRKALGIMQDLVQRNPTNLQLQAKLSDSLTGLGYLLAKNGNITEGAPMISRGLQILKMLADRPEATARNLKDFVESLLVCDPGGRCDAAAALPYAERAVEMTKGSNPDYLDSLARVYFKAGDPVKAVETEEKALRLLPSADARRKQFEATLTRFKKGPPRQPR